MRDAGQSLASDERERLPELPKRTDQNFLVTWNISVRSSGM